MKGKILESEYHPGYSSYVLKQTKYGTFGAEVFLQKEDIDIDNSFDGCRIAEFDCDTKAYKEKVKRLRQRAIGARILYETNKTLIFDTNIEEELYKTVLMLENQADKAKEYYERRKDYRPIFIKNLLTRRREARKMIDERKA